MLKSATEQVSLHMYMRTAFGLEKPRDEQEEVFMSISAREKTLSCPCPTAKKINPSFSSCYQKYGLPKVRLIQTMPPIYYQSCLTIFMASKGACMIVCISPYFGSKMMDLS